MVRLKESTADLHHAAESHPFQRAMLTGSISREQYIRWLGQMLLIHRGLEGSLREAVKNQPQKTRAIREFQYQEPYLNEDLSFLGSANAASPLPATAALLRGFEQRRDEPAALLGFHYVLEGSNNGSKYIAAALRPRLGLGAGPGTRYLDPYGDAQRSHWQQFRQDMATVEFSQAEIEAMVSAAREMFEGIRRLSDDLLSIG